MRKMKIVTLGLLFLAAFTLCDGNYFEGTRIKPINSTVDIAMLTIKEDQNYIIFYHSTTRKCSECERYAKSLVEFADKWKGVLKVYEMDCGKLELKDGTARGSVQKCMRENDHELPKVDFYQPPTSKWDKQQNNMALAELKNYDGPPDIDFMEKFLFTLLTNYGKTFFTSQHLNKYLDEDYIGPKALIFVGDQGITPIMKGLTAFFVDRMDFAFIHPALDEVIEKYAIEKFPALVILRKDTDTGDWEKPRFYNGDWEYLKIRNYCQRFALKTKSYKPEHSFFDKERMMENEEKRMTPEEREASRKKRAKEKKWMYHFDASSFEKEINRRQDSIILVHSFSQKSGKHKAWKTITRKLKGLVTFYELNPILDENRDLIKNEFLDLKPPFIAMYPPGKGLKWRRSKRRLFSSKAPFKKMAGFVSKYTEDPSQSINLETMRIITTNSIYSHKGACILFHNNPATLLSFRKIAKNTRYKKFLNFANFKNPPKDVRETLPTKRFPSVVIFFSDFNDDHEVDIKKYPIRLAGYQGSILVEQMSKFIDEFISKNAANKRASRDIEVKSLSSAGQWESCKRRIFCIIIFQDQKKEQKQREAIKEKEGEVPKDWGVIAAARRVKGKYGDEHNIDAMYIDALCHHDMLPDFDLNVDLLPQVIVVWHDERKYSRLTEEPTFENLDYFVQTIFRGAVAKDDYKPDWKMHSRNCAQYNQQVLEWQTRDAKKALNETETEDEIMKEVIEESKKRESLGKGKKNSGKKKKAYWSD